MIEYTCTYIFILFSIKTDIKSTIYNNIIQLQCDTVAKKSDPDIRKFKLRVGTSRTTNDGQK